MFLINPYILQASGNPLWNGLQAYYTADNTPNDALGNYNGTLYNGATYGTGIINQGFSFDGVNDYAAFGNVLNLSTNSWSYSCWFKSSTDNTNVEAILAKSFNNSDVGRYAIYKNSNKKVRFFITVSSGNSLIIEGSTIITSGVWYNVVVTVDRNDKIKMYLNGIEETTTDVGAVSNNLIPYISTDWNTTHQFTVGGYTSTSYYNGIVDEVGVWENKILSSTEVTELYNSGARKQYPN